MFSVTLHFVFLTTLTWPLCNQVVNQDLPEAREGERIWFNIIFKVIINTVNDYGIKNTLPLYFFNTNHLEIHTIRSIINKIYSNKRISSNNKWKFLTPLKFFYTSNYSLVSRPQAVNTSIGFVVSNRQLIREGCEHC